MDAVVEIANGKLSPDTDFMQHWIARFGLRWLLVGSPTLPASLPVRVSAVEV